MEAQPCVTKPQKGQLITLAHSVWWKQVSGSEPHSRGSHSGVNRGSRKPQGHLVLHKLGFIQSFCVSLCTRARACVCMCVRVCVRARAHTPFGKHSGGRLRPCSFLALSRSIRY